MSPEEAGKRAGETTRQIIAQVGAALKNGNMVKDSTNFRQAFLRPL
jgi:hypothetical protein